MNFIKEHKYIILLILLSSLIIMSPAIINDYYFRGHDTYYHFSNVISIKDLSVFDYINLKIIPDSAFDLAYGSKIFYTSIPHILIALFTKTGLNIYQAFTFYHVLILFLSGISMYLFTINISKNKTVSFLSSMIYITMPYRISNIFIREALAENLLFIAIPLVFLGLNSLLNGEHKKFYLYFVLGVVISVYSHLALAIYLCLFALVFILFNYKKIMGKMKYLIKSSIVIILLILPFIAPIIEHKFFTKYVVFESGMMTSNERISRHMLNLIDFIVSIDINKEIYYFISPLVILFCLIYFYNLIAKKINYSGIDKFFIFSLLISIFLQTNYFVWQYMPDFLKVIQFPWRIQIFTIFIISYLGSAFISKYKFKYDILAVFFLLIIFAKLVPISHTFINQDILKDVYSNKQEYILGWNYEYLPLKAYHNYEYLKTKKKEFLNNCNVTKDEYKKFVFIYSEQCDELPFLYYSGYQISSNNKVIKYNESKNGLIQIKALNSEEVKIEYNGSLIGEISKLSFILGLILYIYIIKKTD